MHAVSKYFLLCFTNLLSIIIADRWRSYRIKACHAECEVFPSSPPQLRFFSCFFFAFKLTVGKEFDHLCMPLGMPESQKGRYLENRSADFLAFFRVSSHPCCLSDSEGF